jgi:hypothetical protein
VCKILYIHFVATNSVAKVQIQVSRIVMVSTKQADKAVLVDGPAVLQGVSGHAWWDDAAGRLVFVPDAAGVAGQAYRDSVAEIGSEWSEWAIEVDARVHQLERVWIIEL